MEIQSIPTALGPNDADDGDAGRQLRGMAISATVSVRRIEVGYLVPSQSGNGSYFVSIDDKPFCACADFEKRQQPCKHLYSVWCTVKREETTIVSVQEETAPKRKTYPQDWPAYNAAQNNEAKHFVLLLRDLCNKIEQPPHTGRGRPRMPLSDMVFAMCMKVYLEKSGRRSKSFIESAQAQGLMDKLPSDTSCWRYMEDARMKPLLRELIQISALPLRFAETDFSIDSSGFSTSVYDRWFEEKWGADNGEEPKEKKRKKWITGQVFTGNNTNVITDADASPEFTGDAPHLIPMLDTTLKHFDCSASRGGQGVSRHLQSVGD